MEKEEKVAIKYTCDCCKGEFESHRVRSGEKLCVNCIEIRRALKSFVKRGLGEDEIIKRGKKLLDLE